MSILNIAIKQDFLKNLAKTNNTISSYIQISEDDIFNISLTEKDLSMFELFYEIKTGSSSSMDISKTPDIYLIIFFYYNHQNQKILLE